jgi:hypothetical protein
LRSEQSEGPAWSRRNLKKKKKSVIQSEASESVARTLRNINSRSESKDLHFL